MLAEALASVSVIHVGLVLAASGAFWLLTNWLLRDALERIAKQERAKGIDPQFDAFHTQWLRQIEENGGRPLRAEADLVDEAFALRD